VSALKLNSESYFSLSEKTGEGGFNLDEICYGTSIASMIQKRIGNFTENSEEKRAVSKSSAFAPSKFFVRSSP